MATTSAALIASISPFIASHLIHLTPSPFHLPSPSSTRVTTLKAGSSDPGATIVRAGLAAKARREGGDGGDRGGEAGLPVVVLMRFEVGTMLRLVPVFKDLASLPIVIFLSASSGDYHTLLHIVRTSPLTLLHPSSPSEAMSASVLASRVARATSSAVVVWFSEDPGSSPSGGPWVEKEVGEAVAFVRAAAAHPRADGADEMEGVEDTSGVDGLAQPVITPATSSPLQSALQSAFRSLPHFLHLSPHHLLGPPHPTALLVLLPPSKPALALLSKTLPAHTGLLSLTQYRPLDASALAGLVPSSVERVLVLEPEPAGRTGRWGPLYLDVVSAIARLGRDVRTRPGYLGSSLPSSSADIRSFLSEAFSFADTTLVTLGDEAPRSSAPALLDDGGKLCVPKHESAYSDLLSQLFGDRLSVANSPSSVAPPSASVGGEGKLVPPHSPEYALGATLATLRKREDLKRAVRKVLSDGAAHGPIAEALSRWLQNPDDVSLAKAAEALVGKEPGLGRVHEVREGFEKKSRWIVGSEAWSHDLGASGLHHALACGEDVNLLLIDSTPFVPAGEGGSEGKEGGEGKGWEEWEAELRRGKKDAGLYAMNYGEAYVASVAVYGDYSQTARALVEADRYRGPSIVVAYLPGGERDDATALEVLKQTKRGIDAGFWPLYRWDPSKEREGGEGEEAFSLDSERIKADLKEFLDRQNHLTLLSRRLPSYPPAIEGGYARELKAEARRRAKEAYEKLAGAISGPPVTVLYASDGGNAEKVAKRLGQRARARGLGARVVAMDAFPYEEELAREENVVLVTSTAGQGEFPQNGRAFWKHLVGAGLKRSAAGPDGGEGLVLSEVRFAVFGMGDSHYWPRPEDAGYYNKPGRDLDRKLEELGGKRLTELGLGDDQHADGYQTGYKDWEPRLWKAFGVEGVEVEEGQEGEPITNEHIKIASNFLRGTIKEGLADGTTGAIAESDGQLTKFHGIYQQDDRDIRDDRKEAGLEPAYSFMVRCRLPAGVCRPEQWLAVDECASTKGNNTFKLTTRQTFQFHGVVKSKLKPLIQSVNKTMMDTIAACGDVNRTVMCSPNPDVSSVHRTVHRLACDLSDHLLPRTTAYAEIWLDKKQVAGFRDEEPFYGPTYLPRKFKIAIAVPPHNDVDVFAHDVGYIAIVEGGKVVGYNVCVGGGMGVTHSMKTTYPRLSDVFGFVPPERAVDFAEKVLTVQRDNGNRKNRKNARVKYTVDRMGVAAFKAEVEKRMGWALEPAREFRFESNVDTFGWTKGDDGQEHFTMFIENGRVEDTPEKPFKTGLREIAKVHKGVFRLTPNQHLILTNVAPEDKPQITALLKEYKLDNVDFSGLRLSSSACVAFPTCGLAMAESERYLPLLVDKVEEIMEENGLRHDDLVMRMTGCPNGCARPWVAEVAFVGKAPGSYLMLLGGDRKGTRLNKPFREAVGEKEILELMRPMIKAYAHERKDGEGFGDFAIRKKWISATTHGTNFYDDMCPTALIDA